MLVVELNRLLDDIASLLLNSIPSVQFWAQMDQAELTQQLVHSLRVIT